MAHHIIDPITDPIIDPEMANPLSAAIEQRDRSVLSMVRDALAARRTRLAYQPVLGTHPAAPGFQEALIRVIDETGRIIPARQFMHVTEPLELGRHLDCAALRDGLETLSRVPDLRLSINMSARSIGHPRWTGLLRRGLLGDPTVAGRLILEVTEGSAMEMPLLVREFMDEWQRRGVSFALDQFGSGQTSFRHLKEFRFDVLKLDGSFVRRCDADADNQCVLRALVSIAAQFGMSTVAEQVETMAEAEFLCAIGIDRLQGHLYGAPTIAPDWLPDREGSPARRAG